jgi:hypothetical protein
VVPAVFIVQAPVRLPSSSTRDGSIDLPLLAALLALPGALFLFGFRRFAPLVAI